MGDYLKNTSRQPVSGHIPLDPPVPFTLQPRGSGKNTLPLTAEESAAAATMPLLKMGLRIYHDPGAPVPSAPVSAPAPKTTMTRPKLQRAKDDDKAETPSGAKE